MPHGSRPALGWRIREREDGPLLAFSDAALLSWRDRAGSLHPFRRPPEPVPDSLQEVASALALLRGLHRGRNRRPVADTIAPVPAELYPKGPTTKMVAGTYTFVARANGFGHVRFTRTLKAGQKLTVSIPMAQNLASQHWGATASGDGSDEVARDPRRRPLQHGQRHRSGRHDHARYPAGRRRRRASRHGRPPVSTRTASGRQSVCTLPGADDATNVDGRTRRRGGSDVPFKVSRKSGQPDKAGFSSNLNSTLLL